MGNVQHIFYEHLLPQQNRLPVPIQNYSLVWPSIYIILGLVLLVVLKITSYSKVIQVIQSCFSMQTLRQIERDEYNPFKFYAVALTFFFLINISFYFYKLNNTYKLVFVESPSYIQFLLLLFITLAFFTFKNGLSRGFALFIGDANLIPEYTYSSFMITQTLGILLYPCLIMAELGPFNNMIFISIASVILIALQAFKWYRGMTFAFVNNKVGFLQIFTYFCTLEILPTLVLVKFIIEKY